MITGTFLSSCFALNDVGHQIYLYLFMSRKRWKCCCFFKIANKSQIPEEDEALMKAKLSSYKDTWYFDFGF
jgi:hypothetical protein